MVATIGPIGRFLGGPLARFAPGGLIVGVQAEPGGELFNCRPFAHIRPNFRDDLLRGQNIPPHQSGLNQHPSSGTDSSVNQSPVRWPALYVSGAAAVWHPVTFLTRRALTRYNSNSLSSKIS